MSDTVICQHCGEYFKYPHLYEEHLLADKSCPATRQKPPPLRVPLKVWKDPTNDQIYLAPVCLRAKNNTHVKAFLVSRDNTEAVRFVDMTLDEWNEMPFFYFKEDGLAPRRVTFLDEDLPS